MKKTRRIGVSNHTCKAHSHLATVAGNMSSLAKVMDTETVHLVMKLAVCPLVQMYVTEAFLNSIKDKKPQSSEEELLEKIQRMILPKHKAVCLAHELKTRPTRILAAAVWLMLSRKYFNMGNAKEACKLFQVRAKQLSRILTGCKYLGGSGKKATGPKG